MLKYIFWLIFIIIFILTITIILLTILYYIKYLSHILTLTKDSILLVIDNTGYTIYSNNFHLQNQYIYNFKSDNETISDIFKNLDLLIRQNINISHIHYDHYVVNYDKIDNIYYIKIIYIQNNININNSLLNLINKTNNLLYITNMYNQLIYANNQNINNNHDWNTALSCINNKVYLINNQITYYDNKYKYTLIEFVKYPIPEYLANINLGIVIFDFNMHIYDTNNKIKEFLQYSNNNFIKLFAENEIIRINTLINNIKNNIEHNNMVLCLLNNTQTQAFIQVYKYKDILVSIFHFDEQYNYGKVNFLYQQRVMILNENISGIFHDVNNIVTAISSNMELLLNHNNLPENIKNIAYNIQNLIMKTAVILIKLLNLYKHRLAPEVYINIDNCLSDFINTIGVSMVNPHFIRLLYKNYGDNMLQVRICPVLFEQILINLISNSIDAILAKKYIHNVGKITISSSYQYITRKFIALNNIAVSPGKYAKITVTDNGTGISAENIKMIFQRHFTTKTRNTGFGLSTVFNIVNQYNGFININSNNSETSFHIYLLYNESSIHELKHIDEVASNINSIKNILFIDDNVNITLAYEKLLKHNNFNVIILNNPINLKEIIRENQIELIVTDYNLAYETGYEIILNIRDEFPNLPVIYMSGIDIDDLNIRLKPFEKFIQKPFTSEQLIDIIKSM